MQGFVHCETGSAPKNSGLVKVHLSKNMNRPLKVKKNKKTAPENSGLVSYQNISNHVKETQPWDAVYWKSLVSPP